MNDITRLKKLAGILNESVVAVPGLLQTKEKVRESESEMQTADTAERNADYAAYDNSQTPATESMMGLDEVAPPGFPVSLEKKLLKQYADEPARAYATMWSIHKKNKGMDEAVSEPILENTSIDAVLKILTTDLGEPITEVYEQMKKLAQRYIDDRGGPEDSQATVKKGDYGQLVDKKSSEKKWMMGLKFAMSGPGNRWIQTSYIPKVAPALHALCKYSPSSTGELKEYLKGSLEGTKDNPTLKLVPNFNSATVMLPRLLRGIGRQIGNAKLIHLSDRWDENSTNNNIEVNRMINDAREHSASKYPDLDTPDKNAEDEFTTARQQSIQVERIINDVLRKVPSNVAGDIRNAIARSSNKLQALEKELRIRRISPTGEIAEDQYQEGYTTMPNIDSEKYTDLSGQGLEGPFRLKSGKVVYYDSREGKYYDRDSDMFMSDDDYQAHIKEEVPDYETKPIVSELDVQHAIHRLHGLLDSFVEPEKAMAVMHNELIEQGYTPDEIGVITKYLESQIYGDDEYDDSTNYNYESSDNDYEVELIFNDLPPSRYYSIPN